MRGLLDKSVWDINISTFCKTKFSKIYDGSLGRDGDIVYCDPLGNLWVININAQNMEYILRSGEFGKQYRQNVFNLIELLNFCPERVIKVWVEYGNRGWVYVGNDCIFKIIFPYYPEVSGISWVMEKRSEQ